MIIDVILDRKDDGTVWSDSKGCSVPYTAHAFYLAIMDYGEIAWDILRALDEGTEADVKKAICNYIIKGEYNPDICNYVNSVEWLDV